MKSIYVFLFIVCLFSLFVWCNRQVWDIWNQANVDIFISSGLSIIYEKIHVSWVVSSIVYDGEELLFLSGEIVPVQRYDYIHQKEKNNPMNQTAVLVFDLDDYELVVKYYDGFWPQPEKIIKDYVSNQWQIIYPDIDQILQINQ